MRIERSIPVAHMLNGSNWKTGLNDMTDELEHYGDGERFS